MRVLLMKQISHILIFVQTANNKIKWCLHYACGSSH
jgi:hypothetical protein